jgi:hypothetical protein
MFSNRYFVEVVAGNADQAPTTHDRLTVRMLSARTGLTDSLVKLVLTRLVNAELLQSQPRGPAPRSAVSNSSACRWPVGRPRRGVRAAHARDVAT